MRIESCIPIREGKGGGKMLTNEEIERVVETYASTLLRVAFSQLKSISEAEDVVQETMLKYLEKAPLFENLEHEKAWLLRVTINICKNHLKTAWFRKTVPLDEEIPEIVQEEKDVISVVMQLSPKYRSIIHLYYYEGYSVPDIAELLGCSKNTVTTRLRRARNILKERLKEGYDV